LYHAPEENVKTMMNKFILIVMLMCFTICINAQKKLATKIIVLNDTTIHQFTNVNELYFLYGKWSYPLQKLVSKLSKTTDQTKANKLIKEIANIKNPEAAVILTLDHFFKNTKPLVGSNVENVLNKLANSKAYYLLNENYFQNSFDENLPIEQFKQKIQDSIGWAYGYGAFYYLSPQDSIYLAKMKKVYVEDIDHEVIAIIEKYVAEFTFPFRYDINAIISEIKSIPYVKDVQHDGCLIKTMQLPNWDAIGIIIIKGKDTVERVYTIQYGDFAMFRLGKHISFPIKSSPDVLFYKGVEYGLHFVALTRKQCEENERQHNESMEKYEEWKKQNQQN
jgi:hypothetical protein